MTRIAAALCLVLLLAGGCGGQTTRPLRVGDRSPRFILPTLDGEELDSRSLGGKAVILNFWATWCEPCLREFPVLKELDVDPRVEVVAIALDEEGEQTVRPFAEHHGLDYTIVLGNEEVFDRFGGFSIPYTLVLDSEQRVVNLYRGPVTHEALERDLSELVAMGYRGREHVANRFDTRLYLCFGSVLPPIIAFSSSRRSTSAGRD